MKKDKLIRFCATVAGLLLVLLFLCGCGQQAGALKDGYYTAEAAEFDDYGWKEYVTIFVSENRIITVEYDAKNASGFIKSWDMDYMREMNAVDGTYPNEYTREYADGLVNRQDPEAVDMITGATHSYHSYQQLAHAAIEQAEKGMTDVAYVALTTEE
ncbi:FMN-binding protein [Christensenellaceae bacterium OttesenSCG-928-K19]|nr:FMN-binding protein [Christensenellaceae bacterium OttesenSCG-928-K19]